MGKSNTQTKGNGHERRRPTKKQKHASAHPQPDPKSCHLALLPLEILAEVLSYTRPYDILALARTSKYFCATLVSNPSSTFIWKQSRAAFTPIAVPDPTSNFTESSYAAFIFDKGVCEICGKKPQTLSVSYSLRLHLCTSAGCRTTWRKTKARSAYRYLSDDSLEELVPRLERGNPLNTDTTLTLSRYWMRKGDWQQIVDRSNKMALSEKTSQWFEQVEKPRLKRRVDEIDELSAKLMKWRAPYDLSRTSISNVNLSQTRAIASSEGWQLVDLQNCPSFHELRMVKTLDLCRMTLQDYNRIAPQVKSEMAVILAKQKRRKDEVAAEDRRAALGHVYKQLNASIKDDEPMPDVAEFRKLPVIAQVQNCGTSSTTVQEIKQSNLVTDLAKHDLTRWQKEAKESLRKLLGYDEWYQESPNALDPLRRLTSRFRCRRCDGKVKGSSYGRGMSFAEACGHRCEQLSPRSRSKYIWKPERFVRDPKATDVLQQLLMWCGYTDDDVLSLETPKEVGTRILCTTCPSHIVMNYDNLLRHCRRHDSMQLRLLSVEEVAQILCHPIEEGIVAQLMERSDKAQGARGKRIYGCRHCERIRSIQQAIPSEAVPTPPAEATTVGGSRPLRSVGSAAESASKPEIGARGSQLRAGDAAVKKTKISSLLTFDGLRSHAKEKHGILWLGDEDVFRQLRHDDDVLDTQI